MQLVRINSLPKGAEKDGPPLRMEDHGGATVQGYRIGDQLYERVVEDSGTIKVFKLGED
jgi:hypothetical protein